MHMGLQPEAWPTPGSKGQSKQSVFMDMDQEGVAEGREENPERVGVLGTKVRACLKSKSLAFKDTQHC